MNLIPYEQRAEIYDAAREKFGADMQSVVALEELIELQKEICDLQKSICKRFRGAENEFQLADEIADVTIMLEQLRRMLGINDLVCKRMDIKVMRLQDRVIDEERSSAAYELAWIDLYRAATKEAPNGL